MTTDLGRMMFLSCDVICRTGCRPSETLWARAAK